MFCICTTTTTTGVPRTMYRQTFDSLMMNTLIDVVNDETILYLKEALSAMQLRLKSESEGRCREYLPGVEVAWNTGEQTPA